MTCSVGESAVLRTWHLSRDPAGLEDVKEFVRLSPTFCHPTCREVTAMATWELAQNILKYGIAEQDGSMGTIALTLEGNLAAIRTRSMADFKENAHVVLDTISRLSSASSVTELYRQRLRELFDNRSQARARLGLLRVAFEGGFHLSCTYDSPYLEISARRRCKKSP